MIRIRVPATSANLGPGFDALGLALALYDRFDLEEAEETILDGCPPEHRGADNLFLKAYRRGLAELGRPYRDIRVRFNADIPLARGLGSSAALLVGGLMAASLGAAETKPPQGASRSEGPGGAARAGTATSDSPSGELPRERLLELAAELEGHPDNTSPALLGGFAASILEEGRVHAARFPIGEELSFSALVPPFPLETKVARAALPGQVSYKDAVYNLSRAALLSAAFASRDWELLAKAVRDRLHEPYRAPLIPGFTEIVEKAREAGALCVYLSGAGPTVMAVSRAGDAAFRRSMDLAAAGMAPQPWRHLRLKADDQGACREPIEPI